MTSLNYVTVTGTFRDGSGAPLTGSAVFTPSQPVYAAGVPLVTPDIPVTAEISGGALVTVAGDPLTLLATDNAGLTLEGRTGFWFWQVSVQLAGAQADEWDFFLPWSTYGASPYDGTVDLYALANTPAAGAAGTVTSVSVESANGFAGTVADGSTTPQITLETTVAGLLKGSSGALTAAVAGTDYLAPGGSGADLTDITAAQVGADASGAAADAQAAAEAASLPRAGGALTGALVPAVVALTDAATIAVSAAAGNDFRVTLGGNRTMGVPSGPADGQKVTFELVQDGTGSRTVTWAAGAGGYSFGSGSAPALSTAAGARDQVAFRYSAPKGEWLYLGSLGGF